jgi:hypothetical protein
MDSCLFLADFTLSMPMVWIRLVPHNELPKLPALPKIAEIEKSNFEA